MPKSIPVALDQLVPVSKARTNLAGLLKEIRGEEKKFFVLTKRQSPAGALINLDFLSKLLTVYQKWQRKQSFAALKQIRQEIPDYPEEEVKKDIAQTLSEIRKSSD